MCPTDASGEFRTIVESAPDAIIVYTTQKFLYLNQLAAQRLGGEPSELVGQPIMTFVHPDSVPIVMQRMYDVFEARGAGSPLEVKFRSRHGEVIPAEIVSVPIVFEGQPARLGIIRDISKRSETERALRESEQLFANAFRMSPHGMCFVNTEGRFTRVNRALCEMLGYSEAELLDLGFPDVTHPDDVAIDLDQLRRLLARELTNYHRIKRYVRKDGRLIWVSVAVAAVQDSEGRPISFIGQLQDITLQRQLEDERANAHRRAGITEATIAVAHEMNNVLTVLMMNAELLANGASPEEVPDLANEILGAANRIASTVQRLRNVIDAPAIDYLGEKKMLDLSGKAAKKRVKKGK